MDYGEYCDACDADARVKFQATISLPSGRVIRYCGHHTDFHAVALLKIGAIILDDREVL